MRKMHS